MTVGVVLTNGLEAVVIADSRVSGFGRQSDSVNKMGVFSSENYSGVIFGAGNANLIEEVIKYANQFSGENLKDFISAAQLQHKSSVDNNDMAYLRYLKGEIDKKADTMFADEAERNQFIQQQTAMAIQQYEQFKNNPEGQTSFILTAFDRSRKKIRNFFINTNTYDENFLDRIEIGSGSDGANMYFVTKLQGLDITKLSLSDMAFFVTNAYSQSTINQGVGGTPKIAIVSEDGTVVLDVKKSRVLANISGAYLAEFPASGLSHSRTRSYFSEVLGGSPRYGIIAQVLGLNKETLTTTYIPFSSWQERANNLMFPK